MRKESNTYNSEKIEKPIQRAMLVRVLACALAFCVLLSVTTYSILSSILYSDYQGDLKEVITHVERNVNADDLKFCIEQGRPSVRYDVLQRFLNGLIDDFSMEYLYIVIPKEDVMVNVVSATSQAEFEAGEDNMGLLETTDAYPREELARYRSFWDTQDVNYFEETSSYGSFYTACKTIRDSQGETIALLCVDVSDEGLHRGLNSFLALSILLSVVIFGVFSVILIVWLRHDVVNPVLALERSARDFAKRSHDMHDVRQIEYVKPAIATRNEVQSLSEAIDKMAHDLQDSVSEALSAEKRAVDAESEARSMTELAFQDSLTHVKSKTAYDKAVEELNDEIAAGNARFGLVMVDLNDLKGINDAYGHEDGDRYIIGACSLVCQVYAHSPVYRIGGDEFIVILQDADYENRDALFQEVEENFRKSRVDVDREVWQRYSAACGMAVYERGDAYEDVFNRADGAMYRNKQAIKVESPNS